MCDTFYLPTPEVRFLGKNSDRNAAEAQSLRIVPNRAPGDSVRIGSRTLDLRDAGHSLAISCPTWMAGAEMGVNGAGVAIGNEAVFSRFKAAPDGILGMEFLRAALMSASSAEEALACLVDLTERYDQGGNGAYKGKLIYNNTYLIAGPDGAYVLETAGKRWAWKRAEGPAAISNAYSLTDDYKRVDAATRKAIAVVNERMACLDEADAGRISDKGSWKDYVQERFYSRFSAGETRRRAVAALLEPAAEAGSRAAALEVLRAHAVSDPRLPGRLRNVCSHDGDIMGNPTTASMLLEYPAASARHGGKAVLWFTGASYACANLFKPILLSGGTFIPLWTAYDYAEGSEGGKAYWIARRAATRRVWRNPRAAEELSAELVEAQQTIFDLVDAVPAAASKALIADAMAQIDSVVSSWDSRTI
ncbi:MAG TPA: hypothetical protein VMX33_03570 [bacterium]|nr:hypothetical protein [bacterium]